MAEGLFRHSVQKNSSEFVIKSAGVGAQNGLSPSENSVQAMSDINIDITDQRSQQWENLEAMNPHRAAHYGSYAFKPMNVLNSMDSGINDITGNVVRLEGHVQNEIVYSEASQSLSISKFGKLKSSLLTLQSV